MNGNTLESLKLSIEGKVTKNNNSEILKFCKF